MIYIKVNMTFAACSAYLVDVMQSQSSEIMAAMKFVLFVSFSRLGLNELLDSVMFSILGAMAIAVILPMIDAYGIAVSYVLCAVLISISYGYVVVPKKNEMNSSLTSN
jgi:hypothetical protein